MNANCQDSVMGSPALPNYHGRQLARELKRLRESAGLRQKQLGTKANFTVQKISRIESGQVPGYHELQALLAIYGVPNADWDRYRALWGRARQPAWWRGYVQDDRFDFSAEDVAVAKYEFQLGRIPALLQTEAYARAALERSEVPASRVEKAVAALARHQERLFADQPLRLHALIHVPALRRRVDRVQLDHLSRCAQLPNVILQVVVQRDAVYSGLASALTLLSFADPDEPDIAFSETLLGRSQTQDPHQVSLVREELDRLTALAMPIDASLDLIKRMAGRTTTGGAR